MTWPDPNCKANHEPGNVFPMWQHTSCCVNAAPRGIVRSRRITEVGKSEADGLVRRARESGAI